MRASLLAAIACLAACTAARAQDVPAYLLAEKSCGVLIKGLAPPKTSADFDRAETARFWTVVNNAIIDELGNYLVTGHRVTVLEIPHAEAPRTDRHVGLALAQRECNRILQLHWESDQDANGQYFAFTASIMRLANPRRSAERSTTGTTIEEYRRAYRFVRTMETLRDFRPGDFAEQVFEDMEKAGALDALRR